MSDPSVSSLQHEIKYRDATIAAQRKQIEQLMEWQRRRLVAGPRLAGVEVSPEALTDLVEGHPEVWMQCSTRSVMKLCRAAIKLHKDLNGGQT